jgi:hypothetical protein
VLTENMTAAELKAYHADNAKRVKRIRREIAARCNRQGAAADGFARRESSYAEAHPHLLKHAHCGLARDDDDSGVSTKRARKVVMPNGFVLWSTWYKVPTTDADHVKASKENAWLLGEFPKLMRAKLEREALARSAAEIAAEAQAEFCRLYDDHAASLAA